ncbi:MAG: Bug family tripartite tricarboxylate transporter substrate binding protein [Geminicoccaceae bacterium]
MLISRRLWSALALVLPLLHTSYAGAADWPERPITMIIMSKEGGGMDRASRLLGEAMKERLGQPVKYVNRPGASGRAALDMFLDREADGYTVFSGNIPTLMMMHGQQAPGYAMDDKLTWLGAYLVDPALLIVHANSPHASLEAFVASAKEQPVRIGVANWSSVQTLALLQLGDATGAEMEIIPYSGFKGAATALLGNHIEGAVGNFSATQKLGDEVRYLGIFADQAPDGSAVEPVAKALDADVINAASIRTLAVHADLAKSHPERFARLEEVFGDTISDPAFVDSFGTIGADPSQAVTWSTEEASEAAANILSLFEAYQQAFKDE